MFRRLGSHGRPTGIELLASARAAAPPPGSQRRLSRRHFLRAGTTAALGIAALGVAGCGGRPHDPATPFKSFRSPYGSELRWGSSSGGFSEWSRHARLANAVALGEDPTREEMLDVLHQMKAQHVSVIEVDTVLSDWLPDHEFDAVMGAAAEFNFLAHSLDLRTVYYYPSLEVISPGGEHGPSFYKTYPDWVQLSLWGQPNVFYGGGVVFWVDPGAESCWLSANGPWRPYYLNRIKQIARTGADDSVPSSGGKSHRG